MTNGEKMNEYRNILIAAEQKSQDDYDKTLVSLSGGALGISFIFIEQVIGDNQVISECILISAWSVWCFSLASIVFSFFFSRLALRKAINQCDNNNYSGGVGGLASKVTACLNALSGLSFIIGVVLIIVFCSKNLGGKVVSDSNKPANPAVEKKGYIPPAPPVPVQPSPNRQPLSEGVIPPPPPRP